MKLHFTFKTFYTSVQNTNFTKNMQHELGQLRDYRKEKQKEDFEMIKVIDDETLNQTCIPEIGVVTYQNIFWKLKKKSI